MMYLSQKHYCSQLSTQSTQLSTQEVHVMSAVFKKSNLTNRRDILRITTRDDAISMKEVENGSEIAVTAYVIQEVTRDRGDQADGEVFNSIMVLDDKGNIYATRSDTFIEKLQEIMDELQEAGEDMSDLTGNPLVIRITKQRSTKGNQFVSCSLA